MKIGYIMSRYPKLTETFIVNEISGLLNRGIEVNIYPLNKEHSSQVQPKAEALLPRVYFTKLISFAILKANLKLLFRNPYKYLVTLFQTLFANLSSLNFSLGVIAYYPKAVYLAELCKSHGITHLHAHFVNHPTMVAYVIHKLVGISFSFTAHGSDLHKRQAMLAEKYRCAKFCVMISKYNTNFFIDKSGIQRPQKLHLVRCGINPQQFKFVTKNSFSTPISILCVAALREVKGHQYLVEAAKLLKQAKVKFTMNFVGDGPKRDKLETLIHELGLRNEVILHGGKTQDEVAKLMQKADIFTLASYQTSSGNREGIPVVIMEAMASGTPVVASDVSGIPELIIDHQTGLLSKPQDSTDIADKLRQLIDTPSVAFQLANKAHSHIENEFDLDKNTEKLISLFRQYLPSNS